MTANDVMKTGDITRNFNETLRIYKSFKELNGFSTLLNLTVSNIIHSFAFSLDSFDISLL